MYTEASGQFFGAFGNWRSTTFQRSGPGCTLNFWYHMYGALQGQLSVVLWIGGAYRKYAIFSTHDDQGNKWIQASVKIGTRYNFAVVFEGMIGAGFTSDMAIDDVSFTNCAAGESLSLVSLIFLLPVVLLFLSMVKSLLSPRC